MAAGSIIPLALKASQAQSTCNWGHIHREVKNECDFWNTPPETAALCFPKEHILTSRAEENHMVFHHFFSLQIKRQEFSQAIPQLAFGRAPERLYKAAWGFRDGPFAAAWPFLREAAVHKSLCLNKPQCGSIKLPQWNLWWNVNTKATYKTRWTPGQMVCFVAFCKESKQPPPPPNCLCNRSKWAGMLIWSSKIKFESSIESPGEADKPAENLPGLTIEFQSEFQVMLSLYWK